MSASMTPELTQNLRNRLDARPRSTFFLRLALLAIVSLALLSLAGCGGGDEKAENKIILATIGEKEITGSYYEDRLSLLKEEELPRDTSGRTLDMSAMPGKEKFLETLINKEVMALTANTLGYGNDPQIVGAQNSLMAYEAGLAMWADEIRDPSNSISEEQLQAFYKRMGSIRQCRYVICNFLDKAQAAREMALTGADWADVVAKYHDGDEDPTGKYEINVPFGRFGVTYERGVFTPAVGEITEPIPSVYGYWVMVIDGEKPGKRPPLEEAKANILDIARGREISRLREGIKARIHEKYKFVINEEALYKCYNGMPAHEDIFYPGTQDPVTNEDLLPLDLTPADMEMVFYSYEKLDGTERIYTLGDYKSHFDKMSVFQRPKRAQMLGGLRNKLTEELEKTLFKLEAEDLGYFENEEVLFKVNAKVEELLVNKLYTDTVTYKKRIEPTELDVYWQEHKADYFVPETRDGRLVVCADRQSADEAAAAASEGVSWRDLLVKYGTEAENKSRSGKIEKVRSDMTGPARDALFELAVGESSVAFDLGNGSFGVVMLEGINEPYQTELKTITEEVGQRMKQMREEENFQALLAKWKADLAITEFPENLEGLKSWRELTAVPVPENLVPRN